MRILLIRFISNCKFINNCKFISNCKFINDCKFDVWNTFKLNNWPTILVVGPDGNII